MESKYKFYPSLLDGFQRLLDSEQEAESVFNEDTENGGYKLSLDEIVARNTQELIDKINRKPHPPVEAQDKGTCFNEVVDALIENRKSSREDVKIMSRKSGAIYIKDFNGNQGYVEAGKSGVAPEAFEATAKSFGATPVPAHIEAKMNCFTFRFDIDFCMRVAEYFAGSVPQQYCEATIDTKYGKVTLYGFPDEIRKDVVYDIKTTSKYEFGKYENHWQRYVYPYCLLESGMVTQISEFEYTPIVLSGGTSRTPIIYGNLFRERYDYDHEAARRELRNICERFIEWIEFNKDSITDKKIFNNGN